MRKLLCFILAFTMLFTSVAASAAMSSDKIPAFLDKAGIIAEGTYADDTKVITRGEFAQMIAKLVNIENYRGLSTTQVFKDIPLDSPLFDVTTLLYQMYFVVGDGNGYFEPDENITAEAACKILVNLMGDQYFATYYGGYIPAAAAKGILKGVELDANSNITVKAAMRLIYNTMIADISNSNMYDGNAVTNNPEKEMFMSKRLGIYMIEGTVTDDGITGLAGATQIDDNQIKIGQYVFDNETGMTDLLGYPVEGFYRHDKESGKNTLIFAYVNENKTNVLEIKDSDIASYANLKYEYYVDADQYETDEAYLNANYRIIYNGHVYSSETKEASFTKTTDQMLKPEYGNLKLIDTDGDSYYDLVVVTDYTIVVVNSIDIENYVVYGDSNYTDVVVDLSKARGNVTVTDADNSTYVIDVINPGTVLSIAKSADGKVAKIKYSNKKETAILSSTDGDIYTIGETDYKATKIFKALLAANPNLGALGDNAVFHLTYDDKIVYCVAEAEASIKTGYFINLHYKTGMDDVLTLRFLTDGSGIADFEVADRVIVDGRLYKNKETLGDYIRPFKKKLVRYRVNQDGKINYIDTPYDIELGNPNYLTEPDDTLHIMKGANSQELRYYGGSRSFAGKFLLDGNTRVFIIPENQGVEHAIVSNYTHSTVSSSSSFLVTAYSTKANSFFADQVIYSVNTTYSKTENLGSPLYGVVTKVTDALNEEGEPVKKLTICSGDDYLEYLTEKSDTLICKCGYGPCATDPIEVGVGDVIAYSVINNIILQDGAIVCYDYSEQKLLNPGSTYFLKTRPMGAKMHGFDSSKVETSIIALTDGAFLLPFYVNRTENNAAEFVFDWWPFYAYSGIDSSNIIEYPSSSPVKKVFSITDAYIVRVNAQAGRFDAMRANDIKVYNDGQGIIEKGVVVMSGGKPIMMVYYK